MARRASSCWYAYVRALGVANSTPARPHPTRHTHLIHHELTADADLCSNLVSIDAARDFVNDGVGVYSWESFDVFTEDFGLRTPDDWDANRRQDSSCGVQIRFWSRTADAVREEVRDSVAEQVLQ